MNIVFNPHKKLHKDLYSQIQILSETFIPKKVELRKTLNQYEETNLSVYENGIYDANIKLIKNSIYDVEYMVEKLTELKTQIPVK